MSFTHALGTNRYGEADLIVSTTAANGTHTTLTSAMAAAVSGQTIFLRDSVTENVTLTAGVNIAAWTGGTLNTPTITGTLTMTTAGTCNISGIRLVTNSAALLAVTGSAASIVNLIECYLNATNNNAITFSSSSGSSQINITSCSGDLGSNTTFFAASGSGTLTFQKSFFTNSGASSTASTISSGTLAVGYSSFAFPVTTSSTSNIIYSYSTFSTITTNTTSLTHGGSGQSAVQSCIFGSGSASAISVGTGATLPLVDCIVSSTNTNAIVGLGTLNYAGIIFTGTSSIITTSTTTLYPVGKIYAIRGITFDNTNTLSIFSQGTFSPNIRGSSTAGTIGTYTAQTGRYQKVGSLVTVTMAVAWSTIGTATGAVQCDNLPFTVINDAGAGVAPSLVIALGGTNLITASGSVPYMKPNVNATTVNINYYLGSAGSPNASVITASNGFSTQLIYETT